MSVETTAAAAVQYVEPMDVRDVSECAFYHVTDLPGVGTVGTSWDLRATIDDYLGQFDFRGKRVLDVGSASGFLTFSMEKKGASVVSFDIRDGGEWDIVPYANPKFDQADLRRRLAENIADIKKAYWFAHRALQSKARAYYGDIYDFPAGLGDFDVVNFGMVLPHLRDPFRALQSATRLSREWVIITHQSAQTEDPFMQFFPVNEQICDPLSWWLISEGCMKRMLEVVGFELVRKVRAQHRCVLRDHSETCTAFVARRVHEVPR
jgi:SAM-dependent methyltransferase